MKGFSKIYMRASFHIIYKSVWDLDAIFLSNILFLSRVFFFIFMKKCTVTHPGVGCEYGFTPTSYVQCPIFIRWVCVVES